MALTTRFIPHSINVVSASVWINGIADYGPDQGIELIQETGGSETDRQFVGIRSIAPKLPIVTSDLSFITTCGMTGLAITNGGGGLIAYGRELPLGALPTAIATTDHLKMLVGDGLLVPVSMSASHNQSAKLSLMLHAILGGASSAMTFTSGQAIASGAGATTNVYTTGPVKFNSVLVQGIKDIHVSFGLQVLIEGDSGDVNMTHVSIIARDPKIEFTTDDTSQLAGIGSGVAISTFAAYFRQVAANNGQRVAPSTATHVSAAGTAGLLTPGAASFRHKSPAHAAFTYTPTLNSTILTLSATAAIPTS